MPTEGYTYRLDRLDRDLADLIAKLDTHVRKVERHDEQISGASGLIVEVKELAHEVASLRKAILTFALGLPVAGITFLLGVLALTQ